MIKIKSRTSGCQCGKYQYTDKKSALTAINWIAAHRRNEKRTPVRAYQCPNQNIWHITSDSAETFPKKLIEPMKHLEEFQQYINNENE